MAFSEDPLASLVALAFQAMAGQCPTWQQQMQQKKVEVVAFQVAYLGVVGIQEESEVSEVLVPGVPRVLETAHWLRLEWRVMVLG